MSNRHLLSKLAQEALIQKNDVRLPNILGECFNHQLDFINNEAKRKVLCIPRRSGKSTAIAIYLINEALLNPKSKLLYIHLTKDEAKATMWHDIFETIFIRLRIQAELVGLEIRFDNGSIIYLTGVDATPKEMHKLRGKKYKLAVIDECQSFTQDLKQLINSVLGPTLADQDATICLCGTPGNQMGDHYWWSINKPNSLEKGWKFFHWTWKENPHVSEKMQSHVDKILEDNPLVAQAPWFKQEYLGEWVIESDARVYKSNDNNYIMELPYDFLKGCFYILSCDLGYHDATAFVISAYNKKYNDKMYILKSEKFSNLTITAVANKIKEYKKDYEFKSIIVDAANLQAVEEMRQIHNLPLLAAEKAGKEAHITLLNSDFITQNVCIYKQMNGDLIKELTSLIWDTKALLQGKHKEDARKENHLTDALLYAHHMSRHWWYKPAPEKLPIDDIMLQQIDKHFNVNQKNKMKYIKKSWWEMEQDDL